MHIALACSSLCLNHGGTERVAVALATHMLRRGYPVTLHSWGDLHGKLATPAYQLPPGVEHRVWNGSNGAIQEEKKLRRYLVDSDTDVFVSLQSGNECLFWATACLGTGIPFIYSEHTCPPFVFNRWGSAGRNAALSAADAVHLLLPCYAASVPEPWQRKIHIIPNVAPENAQLADVTPSGEKVLLYLGRLVDVKRPELLLRAFALLRDGHPDWRLDVWGVGSEAPRLRRLLRRTGLADRVRLRGLCEDAPAAYASSQCYCLPSRLEGFPMTVLEAMSAGLPVVGVADCEAMRGIVTPGKDGLLAAEATPQSLAHTLDTLMLDVDMRRKLGEGTRQTAEHYAPQRVFDQWETLLTEMAGRKGHTVMDSFADEPFVTRAELSRLARQEWLFRQRGKPLPCSSSWLWRLWQRGKLAWRTLVHKARPAQHGEPCRQRREE